MPPTLPNINVGFNHDPFALLAEQKKHDLQMTSLKFQSAIEESKTQAAQRIIEGMARVGG